MFGRITIQLQLPDLTEPVVPRISLVTAKGLVEKLYSLKVNSIKELNSYDDKNYKVDVSMETDNPNISNVWEDGYVLKVLKQLDDPQGHVDAEHDMMRLISKAGIRCSVPEMNIYGKETSIQKLAIEKQGGVKNGTGSGDAGHSVHLVRLMKFIPGIRIFDIPFTPKLLVEAGEIAGQIDKALVGFSHPALIAHNNEWCPGNVPGLEDYVHAVKDDKNRKYAEEVIESYKKEVVPNFPNFKQAVIHGDYNDQNILVNKTADGEYHVTGVIDFGDSDEAYTAMEISICIAYLMIESKTIDIIEVGGYLLKGYYRHIELNSFEKDALKTLVAGRLCQTLVLGAYNYMLNPQNEYILNTAKRGWSVLQEIWDYPKEKLYARWQEIIDG